MNSIESEPASSRRARRPGALPKPYFSTAYRIGKYNDAGGIIKNVKMTLRRSGSALIVYAMTCIAIGDAAERSFQRTTVAAILKSTKRFDGKSVELHGRIVSGLETSIFIDPESCPNTDRKPCALWADFSRCKPCLDSVERVTHERQNGPRLSETPNVTLRGKVYTIRKDVNYDRSVPRSARIGFGHLSAYPAEISIEQILNANSQ